MTTPRRHIHKGGGPRDPISASWDSRAFERTPPPRDGLQSRVEGRATPRSRSTPPDLGLRVTGRQRSPRPVYEDSTSSNVPPPKLEWVGNGPPRVTLTAQYLNSGIFPNGSRTGFVSLLAAAS